MAQQPMTPSKFLHLERSHSKDRHIQTMTDLNLPESSKKMEERRSPILKGSNAHQSPGSSAQKAVSIAEPQIESISPLMRGKWNEISGESENEYFNLDRQSSKHHRTTISNRRLSGRASLEFLRQLKRASENSANPGESGNESSASNRPSLNRSSTEDELLARVGQWLQQERARRSATNKSTAPDGEQRSLVDGFDDSALRKERRLSDASDGMRALDELQRILDRTMSFSKLPTSGYRNRIPKSPRIAAKLRRPSSIMASSDTDYVEDAIVPSCDAILDNTKTLTYTSRTPSISAKDARALRRVSSAKVEDIWRTFKFEIVRLTHTLRIKGWRRVPMEKSGEIEVERLSGALTNAVYVVSPPKNLPHHPDHTDNNEGHTPKPRRPPQKLLLRIYGAQVDHLIDRETELAILRRLARKNIGPSLLGTFANGRFEQFLHAHTLTAKDIRDKEMSRQIAKRMRELHEGIELLPEEREGGPIVWKNIESWTNRCSMFVQWLDSQILNASPFSPQPQKFICGTPWSFFQATLAKYKDWLYAKYGGIKAVKDRLVFAHNDAQYGNILRLTPSGESPLLLPANEHKRLIVIDFEYANANPPGLEFANHFSEWCYDYHDETAPHACRTALYPTTEEQARFAKAYVTHRPKLSEGSVPSTPFLASRAYRDIETVMLAPPAVAVTEKERSSTGMVAGFMTEMRTPAGFAAREVTGADFAREEEERQRAVQKEVEYLLWEACLWRMANSAQWIMWGIMQAKIPGLPVELGGQEYSESPQLKDLQLPDSGFVDGDTDSVKAQDVGQRPLASEQDVGNGIGDIGGAGTEMPVKDAKGKEPERGIGAEENDFDYLGYSRERAMFFWGDAVKLGIVRIDELPEDLREEVRIVEY